MNLSCKQLLEDAKFVVDTVLNVHPRPEFRLGIEELNNAKEEFLTTATKTKDLSDFWGCTAKFMSRIGDAHTEVMALEQGESQAPLILSFVCGQVAVEDVMPSSPLASLLERGDVLLFVNSKEVGQLLREKMDYVAYNHFDHGRNMALPQLLRFPEGSRESVELTVAKGDGSVVSVTSELYSTENTTYEAWQRQRSITALADHLTWKLLDDLKAGYLKYKRCFDRTSEYFVEEAKQLGLKAGDLPGMQEVCTTLFKALKDSDYKRLIIDLRGNSGGNSMVARPLFKYLTRKPLRSYGWGIRASKEAKNLIESSRAKYPEEFQHLLDEILAIPDGEYMNMVSSSIDYPFHSGDWTHIEQFDGEVYILTDANTFSSGEWLAAELRDNDLAIFVGEPTGCGGTVPGDTLHFKTPNAKIGFAVSHKLFARPDHFAERLPAVVPDYHVAPSLEDFRLEKDTVIEWLARRLGQA